MKSIYKACVLAGLDTIERIVVFCGSDISDIDADITMMDPHTNQPVFSEAEQTAITKDNISVIFSSQQIHIDDTIIAIKYKIAVELERPMLIEELYLFCLRSETHSPDNFYRELTQNKRTQLTHARMHNALNNFKGIGLQPHTGAVVSEEKEVYRYDDVVKLEVIGREREVNTVHMLGQRIFLMNNIFPTSFNPFDNLEHDKLLMSAAKNALTTTNSKLLLDSGTIIDGIIYVCLATDVLDSAVRTSDQVTDNYLLSVYFPLLVAQNLHNKADIEADPKRAIIKVDDDIFRRFAREDLLHRIHRDMGDIATAPFTWDKRGISEFKIAIHQQFTLKVPLDVIFKLVPTHPGAPLTKLNPGGHRENMYRLYGEATSTDGRKIPHLSRSTIQHLIINMGTSKSVSVYFMLDNGMFLTCDFEENGDIVVYGKFSNPLSIEQVDELISKHVSPLITTVEPFFTQSGYMHSTFGSLYDKHVEIVHLEYVNIAKIDTDVSNLNMQTIHNCITPAFIMENADIGTDGGARMRYRKVSNFDNMTSQEAFVVAQLKRNEGVTGSSLIQLIMTNYSMSQNDAHDLRARVGAEITVDNGIGVRASKIRTNPGFLTVVSDATEKSLRSSSRISVSVSGIDNILYIPMIDQYVSAMLRLLIDRDGVATQFPALADACAAPASSEGGIETHIHDVHGAPDLGLMNQQNLVINDDTVEREGEEEEATPVNPEDAPRFTSAIDLVFDGNESEDYDSSNEEQDMLSGGGPRNIIGMKLKKPSIFMTAMDEAEPELFLKAKVGNFDRYSRTCDAAYGRQPVILTQEEHTEMIATEHAGIIERYGSDAFYELDADAQATVIRRETETDDRYTVSYGTNPDNQFVYICPRYWCLKTNTFIHPNEMKTVVEDGKEVLKHPTCGGVIPRGQDKVKDDGNYVYEFTGDGRKGKGGYAPQHPGFQEANKHPDGYCVPCCFKLNVKNGETMISEKQLERRKQCVVAPPTDKQDDEAVNEEKDDTQHIQRHRTEGHYIMDQNTHPISRGRWAYLNIEIQHFFKEYAAAYQVPGAPTQLRPQIQALLRHGVESSVPQSFLACMADFMFFGIGKEPKSITEFKEYLASVITLEIFVGLQNGNLVNTFADTQYTTQQQLEEVDVSEYADSPLRRRSDEHPEHSFVKVVLAFNRFRSYLQSPSAVIDHTYTWDLICNPGIHKSHIDGINLVVLEIPDADSTTNVNILCPSNHYTSKQFSATRPTVFIIKRDNIFEPIYSYDRTTTENAAEYTPYFHIAATNTTTPKSVVNAINNIVKPLHNKRCVPLQSMQRIHVFQPPILLDALLSILNQDYEIPIVIQRQILNFSRKVVGLEVKIGEVTGYIPCYPSGFRTRLTAPTTFVDDMTLYHSYVDTIFFSDMVTRTFTHDMIHMQPAYKVVDDEMIIGLLTVADQFIMFSEPIELSTANDDIPILRQSGRIEIETAIQNGATTRDETRVEHVNRIKLETNFFLAYRNTVRILLNDYANLTQRIEFEERIAETFVPHLKKLETIVTLLKQLIGTTIRFDAEIDTTLIRDVSVCINQQPQKCTTANPVCIIDGSENETDDENTCTLVIPKHNLVSPNVDNEIVYINKLADQLIRYDRIRKYMMDPTQFLSFGQAHYTLGEHEFVVAQTVLKNEYFTDLVARKTGGNEQHGNYDETNPATRHSTEHIDTFSETDIAAIAAHTPMKLKIRTKL